MPDIESLVLSGRIVDIMLVMVALEIVLLGTLRRGHADGVSMLALLINIGAGGSLMLALRGSLVGSGWLWISACLLAALLLHIADLYMRLIPYDR